jgi:hypothetical protein
MESMMPKNVRNRRQLSLYVNSPGREELLNQVLARFPGARSLSDAVFLALQEWTEFAETGKVVKPLLDELRAELETAQWGLRKEKDVHRCAVYEGLVGSAMGSIREAIGTRHTQILAKPLSDEQLQVFSREARISGPHSEEFWREVWDRSRDIDVAEDAMAAREITMDQREMVQRSSSAKQEQPSKEEDD